MRPICPTEYILKAAKTEGKLSSGRKMKKNLLWTLYGKPIPEEEQVDVTKHVELLNNIINGQFFAEIDVVCKRDGQPLEVVVDFILHKAEVEAYFLYLSPYVSNAILASREEYYLAQSYLEEKYKKKVVMKYIFMKSNLPEEPTILKSGKLSTNKHQNTNLKLFLAKIEELGQSVFDYVEFIEFLKTKKTFTHTIKDITPFSPEEIKIREENLKALNSMIKTGMKTKGCTLTSHLCKSCMYYETCLPTPTDEEEE